MAASSRRQEGKGINAQRERRAAEALIDLCANRGEGITTANATRIIEQARVLLDRTRGISPDDRKCIDEAREILAGIGRADGEAASTFERERVIIKRVLNAMQGRSLSKHDQELQERAAAMLAHTVVRYV